MVKVLFAGCISLVWCAGAYAITPEQKAGNEAESKAQADTFIKTTLAYQQEGEKLSSASLYDAIVKLRDTTKIKVSQGMKSEWAMDDDTSKQVGYAQALEARMKAHQPEAAYYWARNNASVCASLSSSSAPGVQNAANICWQETLDAAKVGSQGGISGASFMVARMYEKGYGVGLSQLVAANWLYTSAQQALKEGNKDIALSYVEEALKMAPDHPGAMKLKVQLLQ